METLQRDASEMLEDDWTSEDLFHWHGSRRDLALKQRDWYAADWNLTRMRAIVGEEDLRYRVARIETDLERCLHESARGGPPIRRWRIWEALVRKRLGESPNRSLLRLAYRLASSLQAQRRTDYARRILNWTCERQQEVLGQHDLDCIDSYELLANSYWKAGDLDAGDRWLANLRSSYEHLIATSPADLPAMNHLAGN